MYKYGRITLFFISLTIITYVMNSVLMLEERYYDGYEENFMEDVKAFNQLPDCCLDVLFVGSSNIFMDVSPLDIYDKFGIKAYNLATPMQTLQQSYFQLQYAFKTQKPQKVLLDCCAFTKYYENGESYAHMAYDAFPASKEKYAHLETCLPSEYYSKAFKYPFLQYHNRWNELDIGDFDLSFYEPKEDFLGYSPAFSVNSDFKYEFDYATEEIVIRDADIKSLEQIIELCRYYNSELILIKTPLDTWNRSESDKMQELSEEYGLQYWELKELPGLDVEKDFCDAGGHLNDWGARKVSYLLGERLWSQLQENINSEHNDYFEKLYDNLEKNREIQQLKYEKNIDEISTKLSNEDYIIALNSPLNDFSNEIIMKLFKLDFDKDLENEQNMSLLVEGNGNILKWDANSEKSKIKCGIGKHDFYLEQSGNDGSIIQFDYHNYSKINDANIHMVVYSKYYDCVIDVINIGIYLGEIWVTHNNL